jgi:hypothetical protein
MEWWVNPDKSSTPIFQHCNSPIEIALCAMVLVLYGPADAQRPTGKTRIGWLSAVGDRKKNKRENKPN